MKHLFDIDQYPGRPKILFIGSGTSTHTYSWIDLLDGTDFNVRLFALSDGIPPEDWRFQTYTTFLPEKKLDPKTRYRVFPPSFLLSKINRLWNLIADRVELPSLFTIEKSLATVIRNWKPDVIHTLGFDSASYIYIKTRKSFNVGHIGKWVAQARGGPDFMLNQFVPEKLEKIRQVLSECDQFIADNQPNYDFAVQNGLAESKKSILGVVPGTGGLDVDGLKKTWVDMPSKRERIIVWTKTYEMPSSKALPVFEAIKIAWDRIKPCQIYMLWAVQPEIHIWYQTLPEEIRNSCYLLDRISRNRVLELMAKGRVMLAPSLTDGIPNSMLEAMALGSFPIVSPLDTLTPVVNDPENVLFARNLYPHEMAVALERAMNDDTLVDSAAKSNLALVSRIANRSIIRPRLIKYYMNLARNE